MVKPKNPGEKSTKVPTPNIIVTFSGSILPTHVTMCYMRLEVEKYIDKSITQCYKCYHFGHISSQCKADQICSNCGDKDHNFKACPKSKPDYVCVNCKGKHSAADFKCPKRKSYQAAKTYALKNNISIHDAFLQVKNKVTIAARPERIANKNQLPSNTLAMPNVSTQPTFLDTSHMQKPPARGGQDHFLSAKASTVENVLGSASSSTFAEVIKKKKGVVQQTKMIPPPNDLFFTKDLNDNASNFRPLETPINCDGPETSLSEEGIMGISGKSLMAQLEKIILEFITQHIQKLMPTLISQLQTRLWQ